MQSAEPLDGSSGDTPNVSLSFQKTRSTPTRMTTDEFIRFISCLLDSHAFLPRLLEATTTFFVNDRYDMLEAWKLMTWSIYYS